jgi:hypothetical protein
MSNVTISSTTSSQEEMEHAASPNWREPFVPKEAPKVEAPATQETELETAAAPETAEPQESKPKSRAQRAIDKLTARNHRLEAELEEARKAKPAEEKAAPAPSGPPKLQDFLSAGKTADDWADARDAWKAAEETKQAEAERQKATFDQYNKGVSEARGRYEDWDETVTTATGTIPEAASLAVIECDNGADVAYYLAKHPEICEELMEMTPVGAIRRIGKISDSLTPSEKKVSPSEKPRPKPAAPITPVGSSSTQSSTPLDQLPPREYIKVMNKREADRKRGN